MVQKRLIHPHNLPLDLKESDSMMAAIFEFTAEPMLILDSVGRVVSVNPAFCYIFGYPVKYIEGKHAGFLFSGYEKEEDAYTKFMHDLIREGYWHSNILSRKLDGGILPLDARFVAVYNEMGHANYYVGICSSAYQYEDKLDELAYNPFVDPLTGIYNLHSFMHKFEYCLHKVEKNLSILSLFVLDIDNFRDINGRLGFITGDFVLKKFAALVQNAGSKGDVVGRLKDDKFGVIVSDIHIQEKIEEEADRIFRAIKKPLVFGDKVAHVAFSMGVATYPISGTDRDELLKSALNAVEQAKENGGNQVVYDRYLSDPNLYK